MIDIEKIADSIRPKRIGDDAVPNTDPSKPPILPMRLYNEPIFQARDIKDLGERRKYLLSVIEQENEKDRTAQYAVPPRISINGIETSGPGIGGWPEQIRLKPDENLIRQCEAEIRQVNDLLRIGQIIAECSRLGENKRVYFLHCTKEGLFDGGYSPPEFYNSEEFAGIIDTAAREILVPCQAAELPADPEAVPSPTNRAIALYFYYTALHDGQPVSKNNARQLAERFGKANSGKDLYNQYLKVQRDRGERVSISGNANADKARLNNLKTAIELLRADNNNPAVKAASKELAELQNAYERRH